MLFGVVSGVSLTDCVLGTNDLSAACSGVVVLGVLVLYGGVAEHCFQPPNKGRAARLLRTTGVGPALGPGGFLSPEP